MKHLVSRHYCIQLALLVLCHFVSPLDAQSADWRFCYPLPQGNSLHAVWSAGENDVFVGGDAGLVMRWNGSDWTIMNTPTQKSIYSISGTSATDVWAVGGDSKTTDYTKIGLVMHYDGSKWSLVTPPDFSGYTYILRGLTALAPNNAWAVNNGGPSLVRWNGTNWQFDLLNGAYFLEGRFETTFALDANHVFAVGTHGQIVHRYDNLWHTELKEETGSFSTNILTGIWGSDLDNLYACGNWGQVYKRNPNGTWSSMPSVFPSALGNGFLGMTGRSASDIYLLRTQSIVHYDGADTATEISFDYQIGSSWTAGTIAPDGLYLVGPSGTASKYRFAGEQQTSGLSSLSASGPRVGLWNQNIRECGDGFLIYGYGQPPAYEPLLYFDGTIPVRFPSVPDDFDSARETSVYAENINDITMTWWSSNTNYFYRKHWDGEKWSDAGYDYPFNMTHFFKSPTGILYGMTNGNVFKKDKVLGWTRILLFEDLPENVWLTCLWGKSDSEIYVGLNNGQIRKYNGSAWSVESTGTTSQIRAISGYGNYVYAVGDQSIAIYKSGNAWRSINGVENRSEYSLVAMTATADAAYAVSTLYQGGSRIYKFLAGTATVELENLSDVFEDLCTTRSGIVYGMSSSGLVITTAPVPANRFTGVVNTDLTGWTNLGNSGVALRFTEHRGQQYAAAWRSASAPELFVTPGIADNVPASERWTVIQNMGYQNAHNLPPAQVQVKYSLDALPTGLSVEEAGLYRQDGNGWVGFPSRSYPDQQLLQTETSSTLSVWTIARSAQFAQSLNPPRLINLIEDIARGEASYLDLFRRIPTWMQSE